MTFFIFILALVVILVVLSIYRFQPKKNLLKDTIWRIEDVQKLTPEYDLVHYYNLGVLWQERFGFETALKYYRKASQLIGSEDSILDESEKRALQQNLPSNMEFCRGKGDKIDSGLYAAYSERFSAGRSVGIIKPELYNLR